MHYKPCVVALLLFGMVISKAAEARNELSTSNIAGKVFDQQNRMPLPHVEVFIADLGRGDLTDDAGEFQIGPLPAGEHELVFRRQGFENHKRRIILQTGETLQLQISLEPTTVALNEVVITASRRERVEMSVPQMISVLSEQEIKQRNGNQTPELLREEPGVMIQKTNQGGGSPNLRGFKANKVLLLVDGIRMNNATYRGGNVQYLGTVDAQALERIEIVHGPGSALYGSDALGGVINLMTKSPRLHNGRSYEKDIEVSAQASTADATRLGSLGFAVANSRWGVRFDAAAKSYGDVTRGSNSGELLMFRLANDSRTPRVLNQTQSPNGYEAQALASKVILRLTDNQELTASYQIDRQWAVPRYDVVEVLSDSIRLFDPQKRDLTYLTYGSTRGTPLFDRAAITLSAHRQFEGRLRQKFGSLQEQHDEFRTLTYGAQLQLNKLLSDKHFLVYGVEHYYDRVASQSSIQNTATGETAAAVPIFPDGSTFSSLGVYAETDLSMSTRWTINFGARFSAFELTAPFDTSFVAVDFGTVKQSFSDLTASLGSRLEIADGVNFLCNVAQGFRAPNLDDVVKIGPGKGAGLYDVPNPNVGPERTLSFDAGVKATIGQWRMEGFAFYNYLTDLLVRQPASFNGLPYILEEGDTLQVFHKGNAGNAYLAGFTLQAEMPIRGRLRLRGSLNYTYGQNVTDREPLSSIAPLSGLLGLRWQHTGHWLELHTRFAGDQKRLSLEDEEDLRIPEGGTPGWYTLNLRGGVQINRWLSVRFGLENVTDQNYREHTSGLNAPGRNFAIGGAVKF